MDSSCVEWIGTDGSGSKGVDGKGTEGTRIVVERT